MSENKVAWLAGALFVVCLLQTAYIFRQKRKAQSLIVPPPVVDLSDWVTQADKEMAQGRPVPFRSFDSLFNDRFFNRKFDPFSEMEKTFSAIDPLFKEEHKPLFEKSWDDWFGQRMNTTDISTQVSSSANQVIVSAKIAGLKEGSLNVNVDENRIRMSYSAKKTQEQKDAKGNIIQRSESEQDFEKILPIPQEADPKRFNIVQNGDEVKIIFDKRQHSGGNS